MNFRTSSHAIYNLVESELKLYVLTNTSLQSLECVLHAILTRKSNRDVDSWSSVNVFVCCRYHKRCRLFFFLFFNCSHKGIAQSILLLKINLKLSLRMQIDFNRSYSHGCLSNFHMKRMQWQRCIISTSNKSRQME